MRRPTLLALPLFLAGCGAWPDARTQRAVYALYAPRTNQTATAAAVAPDGLLLTCWHAVERARSKPGSDALDFTIRHRGRVHKGARLVAAWPERELALLRLDLETPDYLVPADAPPPVGCAVYALGLGLKSSHGVARGKVLAVWPKWKGVEQVTIAHDADIWRGDSGGPLVDGEGRLVGVNHSVGHLADGRNVSVASYVTKEDLARLEREGIPRASAQ